MPDSENQKEVSSNDLRNSQFGGGFINAETVNAGQIGGDIYNIHLGQQAASGSPPQSQKQKERWQQERDSLEKAYTLQSQRVNRIRNRWVIETDPSRKFQHEQELQLEELTLRELGEKLDAIEQQLQPTENSAPEAAVIITSWELVKHTAIYAPEELKMIDIKTREEIRGLDKGEIPNDDSLCIKLGQPYRLHIIFPYIGKNLLLIKTEEQIN